VLCRDETTSTFVSKVTWGGGESFVNFPTVAVRSHSSMRNLLFGLPGGIHCEQSPWGHIKWWACCWLTSSPVSPFPVSVSFDFPCTAHAFFPEHLSDNCQGIRRTFSEIYTKMYPVPLSDPSWKHNRSDIRFYIKGRKKSVHPPISLSFYTLTSKIC
jgi:hypothetical protein